MSRKVKDIPIVIGTKKIKVRIIIDKLAGPQDHKNK